MTKEEWQKTYSTLDETHTEFLLTYPEYNKGKNQKIRDAAGRKLEILLHRADFTIRNNAEIYNLLTGDINSDYGRTIAYDEFLQFRYFGNDMTEFLQKIKRKIKSLGQ